MTETMNDAETTGDPPPISKYQINTPVLQGMNTPRSWKPTAVKPIPVVRCTRILRNGEQCNRWSLRGATVCLSHGGRIPNVVAHAAAVVEAARLRLIDASDEAVETIIQLTQPGTAEGIRLKAATEVLDRAGIRGGYEVDVEVTTNESTSDIIRKKLDALRNAKQRDNSILDAEIVPEDG